MAMMTRLLPASPSTPWVSHLKVLPATRMRSIHALSWLGMVKLYIGAPITTISAAQDSFSLGCPAARGAGHEAFRAAPRLPARLRAENAPQGVLGLARLPAW